MAQNRREMRLRSFAEDPRLAFIGEEDRYLFKPPEPQLRFNLIGCGTMGLEHLRVTHLEGRAEVRGVHDPHAPSLAEAVRQQAALGAPTLTVHDTLEAACTDPEADALIISTPNFSHWQVLQAAMESGKPILLEKPMATSLADAHAMARAADAYAALLQIGLQYRFKPVYREALGEIFDRCAVGEVKHIRMAEYRPPFLDKVGQWNKFNAFSGGTLVEKCCHYFDLLNLVAAARPVRVFASGGQAVNFRDFERDGRRSDILDHADVLIEYANGVRGSFTLNMFAALFAEELTVTGSHGHLRASESGDVFAGGALESVVESWAGENGLSRRTEPRYPAAIESSGHSGATFIEHRRFVDALLGGPADCASVWEGFWAVVVGIAAQRSIASGAPVVVEEMLAGEGIAVADAPFGAAG